MNSLSHLINSLIYVMPLNHSRISFDTYLPWTVQRSWLARVSALCNFSCKKSRKVGSATSRPISEQALDHTVYNHGIWTYNYERNSTNARTVALCKNYRDHVMEDEGEKGSAWFPGWPEDCECVEKNEFFGFVSPADNIRAWVRVSTADLAISSGQGMSAW